ncbi:MAG: hypothetical protein COA82_03755 [Alkaliphilus sp.]|nr:MAG: hypothetical protein COA82_03755 [Alkaliphilus sp.]
MEKDYVEPKKASGSKASIKKAREKANELAEKVETVERVINPVPVKQKPGLIGQLIGMVRSV